MLGWEGGGGGEGVGGQFLRNLNWSKTSSHVINSFFSGTETVTRDRHLEFKVVQVYYLDKAAAHHISGFFATQIWSELKLPRNIVNW